MEVKKSKLSEKYTPSSVVDKYLATKWNNLEDSIKAIIIQITKQM